MSLYNGAKSKIVSMFKWCLDLLVKNSSFIFNDFWLRRIHRQSGSSIEGHPVCVCRIMRRSEVLLVHCRCCTERRRHKPKCKDENTEPGDREGRTAE